jgi:hypothetical protein
VSYLSELVTDPKHVNDVLKICLDLEDTADIEIPLAIMKMLKEAHPYNEIVAYTYVRMSGYSPDSVREYLNTFAKIKGEKPYAVDFLEHTISTNTVVFYNLLSTYIDNKLPAAKRTAYHERLDYAKKEYIGKGFLSSDNKGMLLMYILYGGCTLVNIGLVFFFIFVDLAFLWNAFIGIFIFCVELFGLYMHNRTYGNRIGISQKELIFLVCFLSSIPITIAGMVIALAV